MRTLLVTVMLVLTTMVGCKKKSDVFMFDCTVYDERVDAAVSGASVTMLVQRADGGFNPNFEIVGSATTDASGRFYIEVEKGVFYAYRVDVSHPTHFNESFSINPDDVPFSTAYSETFVIDPKAWIATHLINQNMSQTATFAVVANNGNCTECCSGGNTIVQGANVDSVFICPVYGEQQISVAGNYVDENGGVHQIAETAYVQAFDTTTVTVIY
ncbi:MAG: hypothetical protein H6601_08520 [Flavobacteriales bacterium]|nr:hypothetical protein [Flavobacteriales bacterium]MCB9186775.1 hypothetical protein [Flavobacteriales bacterium]